ncbi:MAG TPA: hypothetical protein PK609_02180 [Candidatus Paceibacterota bacterium]|nr:hypothetical protein [Candidatus Paceibacterota bacterium]
MTLVLHPHKGEVVNGMQAYSLYDSPKNRPLPSPKEIVFVFSNQNLVAQAHPHPDFTTIVEVYVEEGVLPEQEVAALEELKSLMSAA